MPISLPAFTHYIQKHSLITQGQKIILTFSGGVDSVVLATLFKDAGYNFALAHCNFSLRDNESDGDEDFARSFAQQQDVPFFSIRFDTKEYAKQQKVSTQVAARELRYNWFYELLQTEKYDLLATAHHQTDQVETMLLNITRGTGLAGIEAIKPKEEKLIRPLLVASRVEVVQFAKAKKLKWREDSSNKSNKYNRNKIRNVVLPVLKGLNPKYEESFYNLSQLVGQYRDLLKETIAANTKGIINKEEDILKINKNALMALPNSHLYLYELLSPYGFNNDVITQIAQSIAGQSGAVFHCKLAEALIDREEIVVRAVNAEAKTIDFELIEGAKAFTFANKNYEVSSVPNSEYKIEQDNTIAQLDADKLQYPLKVRSWKQGDYFYPLGMRKKKKVSDFFIDEKITVFEKQEYPLLFSDNHLVCIAGLRVDDRFKITDKTKTVLIIKAVV